MGGFDVQPEHLLWMTMLREADKTSFHGRRTTGIFEQTDGVDAALRQTVAKMRCRLVGADDSTAHDLATKGGETTGDMSRPTRGSLLPLCLEHRNRCIGTESTRIAMDDLIEHEISHKHGPEGGESRNLVQ